MKQIHPYILKVLEEKEVSLPDGGRRPLAANIDSEEAEFLFSIVSEIAPLNLGIEVGLACGISAGVICHAASSRNSDYHHIAIDPFQSRDYKLAGVETAKACGTSIQLVEEVSDLALPDLVRKDKGQADIVFIDGLHTFDATLNDMMSCLKLLRVGGLMIIDDCRMPPVAKAVAYCQKLDCMKTVGGSPNNSRQITRLLSLLAGGIPRGIAELMPRCIYNRLYPRSWMSTMMVLQKTESDERHWNWYEPF